MAGNNHSSFGLPTQFDVILERMDFQDQQIKEIKDNVAKVSELVADPENGIYGRVKSLEVWKGNYSKFLWILVSAIVGLSFSSILWMKLFTG